MKVEKDLREADGVQDERRKWKNRRKFRAQFCSADIMCSFGDGYFSGDKDICRK